MEIKYKLFSESIRQGINELEYIKYYVLLLDEPLEISEQEKYDVIMLTNFKADDTMLTLSSKLFPPKVSFCGEPHIDRKTGNIHPGENSIKDKDFKKVHQLVLSVSEKGKKQGSHPGPNTPKVIITDNNKDDYYIYEPKRCRTKTIVHKSCYYPRIDGVTPVNDKRYEFLKTIAEQIKKDYPNLLDDELKEEITK